MAQSHLNPAFSLHGKTVGSRKKGLSGKGEALLQGVHPHFSVGCSNLPAFLLLVVSQGQEKGGKKVTVARRKAEGKPLQRIFKDLLLLLLYFPSILFSIEEKNGKHLKG